jgi:hypothetical protein
MCLAIIHHTCLEINLCLTSFLHVSHTLARFLQAKISFLHVTLCFIANYATFLTRYASCTLLFWCSSTHWGLQTPIRATTQASRFLRATFFARYATLRARYATLLTRYVVLFCTLRFAYCTLNYAFRPLWYAFRPSRYAPCTLPYDSCTLPSASCMLRYASYTSYTLKRF